MQEILGMKLGNHDGMDICIMENEMCGLRVILNELSVDYNIPAFPT
jgi:hypothetical protein